MLSIFGKPQPGLYKFRAIRDQEHLMQDALYLNSLDYGSNQKGHGTVLALVRYTGFGSP